MGKRTAQKDTITDITSDSQLNSNFPHRWSPASPTFNNYFTPFLYLYKTCITINNNAPHLKSPKDQNRKAALERPAIKITGGGGGGVGLSKPGSKSDSGGIAIYIRNEYVYDDIFFLQNDDDILWLKISGSKINLENDLYLGLCYLVTAEKR